MHKSITIKNIKKLILIFLIIPITGIFLISGKDKIAPSELYPNPKKGYIYGRFHAYAKGVTDFYTATNWDHKNKEAYTLTVLNMDSRTTFSIYFRSITKDDDKNHSTYIIEVDPGIYKINDEQGSKYAAFEPINEEFEVKAGEMYYIGNYLRSYKIEPNVIKWKEKTCNHQTEITRIIKMKYPHFSNMPTGSIYAGDTECSDLHLNSDLFENGD